MDIQHQISVRELRQQRQDAITGRLIDKKRELQGSLVRYSDWAATASNELHELLTNDDSNEERIDELIFDLRGYAVTIMSLHGRLNLLRELG